MPVVSLLCSSYQQYFEMISRSGTMGQVNFVSAVIPTFFMFLWGVFLIPLLASGRGYVING